MTDMLKLSFYGKQNDVARHRNSMDGHAIDLVKTDRWAGELAESSVSKVFPLKNRWKLGQLALHEVLSFPRHGSPKLKDILDSWPQQDKPAREWGPLWRYMELMAGTALDPVELPPIMPYRAAHQIVEQALTQRDEKQRALEAVRHIVGGYDSEDLIRISRRSKQNGEKGQSDPRIEYFATGTLIALFPEGFREQTGEGSAVVLSARPDIVYRTGSERILLSAVSSAHQASRIITSAVLVASLTEDGYGVVATGLVWNIRLALAWTEERVLDLNQSLELAFQWPVYIHPSPLQLMMWSREWRDFIDELQARSYFRLERIAYAWIYYQLKWMRKNLDAQLPAGLKRLPKPLDERFNEERSWRLLLNVKPETGNQPQFWWRRQLQLLACPEFGIPREVQEYLLEDVREEDIEWLWVQRRRSITDAIVAAADQANRSAEGAEDEDRVNRVAKFFDERHSRTFSGSPSPWEQLVEDSPAARQRKSKKAK